MPSASDTPFEPDAVLRPGGHLPLVPRPAGVPVLSGHWAHRLLDGRRGPHAISLDLGRSEVEVLVYEHGVAFPDGQCVALADLRSAFSEPEDCLDVSHGRCRKLYVFDAERRTYYKLFHPQPDSAPTIVINGATMHAIVRKDPWGYTADKLAEVPAFRGDCLDTCFGLGYSAQMLAARSVGQVTTCEVDPNALEMAALNPWSAGAFLADNVRIVPQDMRDCLSSCADSSLACVFHDPPTVYQAGDLYAGALYREFARVLRRGGVLYHYVGAPGRRVGRDFTAGVARRLRSAGFRQVRAVTDGVLARC